jgi:hypothetical protein
MQAGAILMVMGALASADPAGTQHPPSTGEVPPAALWPVPRSAKVDVFRSFTFSDPARRAVRSTGRPICTMLVLDVPRTVDLDGVLPVAGEVDPGMVRPSGCAAPEPIGPPRAR